MNPFDQLKQLQSQANKISEDNPAELRKKIVVLAHELAIIGKFHADAVRDAGLAETERKNIYSATIIKATGTATDKQAQAELSCSEARKAEAIANGEMWRWRNAYNSMVELINALKKKLDSMSREYDSSNTENYG